MSLSTRRRPDNYIAQVWITSKLASGTVNSYAKGIAAVDNILQEIGTTYLDLVLIHSPKMGKDKAVAVWKSLIDAKKAGTVQCRPIRHRRDACSTA